MQRELYGKQEAFVQMSDSYVRANARARVLTSGRCAHNHSQTDFVEWRRAGVVVDEDNDALQRVRLHKEYVKHQTEHGTEDNITRHLQRAFETACDVTRERRTRANEHDVGDIDAESAWAI